MAQAPQLSLSKLPLAGKIGFGAFMMALAFGVYWVAFYSDISASGARPTQTRSASKPSSRRRARTRRPT